MPLSTHKPMSFNVAVITVCVEKTLAAGLLALIEEMPWAVTSSSFGAYLSDSRRPSSSGDIKSADACLAIIDFDADPAAAAITISYLQHNFIGNLIVVGLATAKTPDMLLLAMRSGCREFLQKPLDVTAVQVILERLQELWSGTSLTRPAVGTLLSLLGPKGGVGTTTLAVHLAMYLVQTHQKRVLLVDSHPELGHVCIYLGMDGAHCNLQEVIRNVNRLDSELLQGYIASHSSGLDILSSPETCDGTRFLDAEAVATTLHFLRNEYEYVIVDCSSAWTDINRSIFEASSSIYFVSTPDVAAIRDLARFIDKLKDHEALADKLHIVANRVTSSEFVNLRQMEKAIGRPLAIKLPAGSSEVAQAGNLGQPISSTSKSDFAEAIRRWAYALAGPAPTIVQQKSFKPSTALWKNSRYLMKRRHQEEPV